MKVKLLTVAICVLLSACGGSNNSSAPAPTPAEPTPVTPPPADTSYDFTAVAASINAQMSQSQATAVSVAVSRDGDVIYEQRFGTNHPGGTALNADTQFQLGSTTKMFAAMGLLKLIDQGAASLQDPLLVHMPDIEYPALYADYWGDITLHDLLAQQSGLLDWNDFSVGAVGSDLATFTSEIYPEIPPMTRAGNFYSYSNPNYVYVGALIERLSGEPFATWMEREIFEPLGMENTTFLHDKVAARGNYALGMSEEDGLASSIADIPRDPVAHAAGSATWSTPGDTLKMAAFLFNGNTDILSDDTRAQLTHKQVAISDYRKEYASYGYGIVVEDGILVDRDTFYPMQVWQHDGGTDHYGSQFYMFPEQGVAISILANNTQGEYSDAIVEVLKALNLLPEPIRAPLTDVDESRYAEYVGTYSGLSVFGELTFNITLQQDQLHVEIPVLDESGVAYQSQLLPLASNTLVLFTDAVDELLLTFRDLDGEPGMDVISGRLLALHKTGFQP